MTILKRSVSVDDLSRLAGNTFGDMIKAVVDVERRIIAIDADLHADLETLLLEDGSSRGNLWGINLYPGLSSDDFIEFDSLINMRPSQSNLSRSVEDEAIRQTIIEIVWEWIDR